MNVIRITCEQHHSGRFVDDSAFYVVYGYIFGTCRGTVAEMALTHIALFPGARKLGVSGTHCLRMCGSPGFSGELGNFCKICSITLSSVCQSISLVWKMLAIDLLRQNDDTGSDGNTQPFACKSYSPVCPFQVNTVACERCNLCLWSSSIALNEMIQANAVKTIAFVTLKFPNVSHREHNSAVWLIRR